MENFKYGQSTISLNTGIKEGLDYLNYQKKAVKAPETIVRESLINSSMPLCKFIQPGCSVVIIVSDYTRPTGSEIYIPILLEELQKLRIGSIKIVIALGLHRPAAISEIEIICGGEIPAEIEVVNHNAEDNLLPVGDAEFNHNAVKADRVIVTGAVTFHPMAGFSGGRKSLMPGIASSADIHRNHRLYFNGSSVHKGIGPANINNNPVLKDIRERTAGFNQLWAFNVVLTEQNIIEFASSGEIDPVWDECRKYVSAHHSVEIKEKYDLVISSAGGYPSDHSFYQSMKVLTNSSMACKPGGILIILSQCIHGWEIRDHLFSYFNMTLEEISQTLHNSFSMDGLALYMALSIIRSYNVWLYSDLPEREVRSAGMNVIRSLKDISGIVVETGSLSDKRTAVMYNGSAVLPISTNKLRGLL
jgi:lactate racemase